MPVRHVHDGDTADLHHAALIVHPVGVDAGVHVRAVFFLGQVGQILPVADRNATVCAPPGVQLYSVVVPLVFAAIHVQYGAVHAAQQAAQAGRFGVRKLGSGGQVRPDRKRAVNGSVGFQPLHGQGRRTGCKRRNRHTAQIVADMLCVDCHQAIDGTADFVDAEILRLAVRIRLGFHQAAHRKAVIVLARDGVLHFQLIAAIALLSHGAIYRIAQRSQAVALQTRGAVVIYRDHSVHHLGVIFRLPMPPVQLICVMPGSSVGKSGAVI